MPEGYRPYYSIERGTTTATIGAPADIGASTDDLAMQITIDGTATVLVEASQNNQDWENVSDPASGFTVSTIVMLDRRVAFYRAHATAVSGTVSAVIGYARGRFGEMFNVAPTQTPSGFAIGQIDVSGLVPSSHQITAALPLRVNGGASATLATNPTALTFVTTGTTDEGIVTYDAATGGYKVQPATVGDSGDAVVASLTADGQVASSTNLHTPGILSLARKNLTLANGDNDNVSIGAIRSSLVSIFGPSASFAITGFVAPASNADLLFVFNTTSETMTIKNEAGTSLGPNRINTLTGGDVTLQAGAESFASFFYDTNTSRWIMTSTGTSLVGSSVLLQGSTPGTPQAGNFNVNGTGIVKDVIAETVSGDVAYSGISLALTGQLSFARLLVTLANGNNDNISITSSGVRHSYIQIDGPTGAFAVTGFANNAAGEVLFVQNTVTQAMTIKNASGSSAANQILTLTGADVVLPASQSFAVFIYDTNAAKWILVYAGAGSGSGAPGSAEYLVGSADATLSAERVVTDTTSITWDLGTAAQAKAKRAALTGDVTAAADANATTIANDAVTYAKMQNVSAASRLLGRGSAAGAGDPEEITLGAGLAMSTTTLALSSAGDAILGQSGIGGARISGLQGSPDIDVAAGDDDEFNTTDTSDPMTGWTTLGTPTTHDINSTAKSHYYVKQSATAGTALVGIYKAKSPAFTVTCKLTDSIFRANNNAAGVFVGEATPGKILALERGHFTTSTVGGIAFEQFTNPTTWSATHQNLTRYAVGSIYLRIVVTSSTNIAAYWSHNGLSWHVVETGRNPSFTVGSAGIFAKSENATYDQEAFFDWIRFS